MLECQVYHEDVDCLGEFIYSELGIKMPPLATTKAPGYLRNYVLRIAYGTKEAIIRTLRSDVGRAHHRVQISRTESVYYPHTGVAPSRSC
jgi:hypothetical protein